MLFCASVSPVGAVGTIADPAAFLAQTESLGIRDHARFVQQLAQIHREAPALSPADQWRLRYLDAWETMFGGDYPRSEAQLREIIAHSGDSSLKAKASALLMSNLGLNRRYEEAFALANSLASSLPDIADPAARSMVLLNLSQAANGAGQIALATQYADIAEASVPSGESPCRAQVLRIAALQNGKRLTSSDPDVAQTIQTCVEAGQRVYANAVRLILGDLYLGENQPRKALALLGQIDQDIQASHYHLHMVSGLVQRAKALVALGNYDDARKAGLAAIAMRGPGETNEWLRDAYETLYKVEKAHGDAVSALSYYEQYVAQDRSNLDDITARGLAFELSQQHTLLQKLETERLSKQNSILRLQKSLETKAVETGRLYIVLLLMFLASVVFWLVRLKLSQLRFKKLSCHDGLTGIYNRQHFMSEADRVLGSLEKRHESACLVFIDLDHFKEVNDNHGHAMGDLVLMHTVAICRQQLRPTDLFGRLGGEEFGVLLADCPRAQGLVIADRIRMAIEASPVVDEGRVVSFSASAGLASTSKSGHELQRLCRDADVALYRAKRAGRNRVMGDIEESSLAPS